MWTALDKVSLGWQALAEMPKTPRFPPNAARVVDILAYPAVQLLDVTGPVQVFASANVEVMEAGAAPPYALKVVAKGTAQVTASAGLQITTEKLPRASAALDTLIVAGGPGVAFCDAPYEEMDPAGGGRDFRRGFRTIPNRRPCK